MLKNRKLFSAELPLSENLGSLEVLVQDSLVSVWRGSSKWSLVALKSSSVDGNN